MMNLDAMHVRAVIRKELRDYRRKRSIVVTMGVLPLLFLLQPALSIFLAPSDTSGASLVLPILCLLLIPTIMPSTLAAYTVVGERDQGTLEPLLTTPLRQQEFLLGKAASVLIPTLALSYIVFGLFLVAVWLGANSAVASAVLHDSAVILALFLFAPLGAALGFHVISGLMGLITAVIGAAVVSTLSLLVLDIRTSAPHTGNGRSGGGSGRAGGGSLGTPGAGPVLITRTGPGNPWRIPRHGRV